LALDAVVIDIGDLAGSVFGCHSSEAPAAKEVKPCATGQALPIAFIIRIALLAYRHTSKVVEI
jgi:hypothetical protein